MKKVHKKDIHPEVSKWFSINARKAGSVKSERKTIAVRKNGCAPCRPGKFRGRPAKKAQTGQIVE